MNGPSLLESLFPNLANHFYRITSKSEEHYNCIAHAAGRNDLWWQPTSQPTKTTYWPDGIPKEWTLEALIALYESLEYAPCDGAELEPGFEKIALFVDSSRTPTHAARQLPTGAWTSKLGELEDIEHETLSALEGEAYGVAVRFMKRPRRLE
jgi:hypothetical protein